MRLADLPEIRDAHPAPTYDSATPLNDALRAMSDRDEGALLVTDNGVLSGIFTERDFIQRVVSRNLTAEHLTLKDVMTPNVDTAKVDEQARDVIVRMDRNNFHHMPVLDAGGTVIAVLSRADFGSYAFAEPAKAQVERKVEDATKTVKRRYQPFFILLALIIWTIISVSAIEFWLRGTS